MLSTAEDSISSSTIAAGDGREVVVAAAAAAAATIATNTTTASHSHNLQFVIGQLGEEAHVEIFSEVEPLNNKAKQTSVSEAEESETDVGSRGFF